jgi:hypothetical protein
MSEILEDVDSNRIPRMPFAVQYGLFPLLDNEGSDDLVPSGRHPSEFLKERGSRKSKREERKAIV